MDLKQLLEANDLSVSATQLDQYERYASLLVEWNEKFNLTAITQIDDIYVKHFLDCLLLTKYNLTGTLCDVGTGAGFPALVLKIYYPDLEVTMLEPNNKKVSFLNKVIEELKLDKIKVYNSRAEEFAQNNSESFDYVTSRAVASLNILAELCLPLLKVNGHFLPMKGPKALEEIHEAQKALKTLNSEVTNIQTFTLDEQNTRIIIDITKKDHINKKYPRNYAQIKKKPL